VGINTYLDRVLQVLVPCLLEACPLACPQGKVACHQEGDRQGTVQEEGLLLRMAKELLASVGQRGLLEASPVDRGLEHHQVGHLVRLDIQWVQEGMDLLEEVLRHHLVQRLTSRRDPSGRGSCVYSHVDNIVSGL
jgi:hypothetical protein